MVPHDGEAEGAEKQGQKKVDSEAASQADKPRILYLRMLPIDLDSSYTPTVDASPRTTDRLALIIPTLREAKNLPGLLADVRKVLDATGIRYEIIVVDDDSRDGTEEIVTAIGKEDPRVRLVVRKGERGLSGAVLYGWRQTDAEILGVMDADLQHPPELLAKLLAAIRAGNDLAIGSRYTKGGQVGNWNPIRKGLSTIAVWATWPIQRSGVRRRHRLPTHRLQAAFGDSGARSAPLRGRGAAGIWSALARRQQGQLQSGLRLRQAVGAALCGPLRFWPQGLRAGAKVKWKRGIS
jgi:hypothetical protein